MSRMTKYLRQSCVVQPYQVDEAGQPVTNRFGELVYLDGVTCKCRYEMSFEDVQTSNGHVVKSTARYFLDESVDLQTDYLIDGRAILSITSYVNQRGQVEGYEVYV